MSPLLLLLVHFVTTFHVETDAPQRMQQEGPLKDLKGEKFIFYNLMRRKDVKWVPKERSVLFMWEPPVVFPKMYTKRVYDAFSKVYTWNDDLVDGEHFIKFFMPSLKPMLTEIPPFQEKRFCTMVVSNNESSHPHELYSHRRRAIEFFERWHPGEFEFYGRGWEKCGYTSYRGAVQDKLEAMLGYRFAICYENSCNVKGYITEKIFDCFAAGCVPVYWGASNVTDYIPANCFIDRRNFHSLEDLYLFMKGMDAATYEAYLTNIRAFLESDEAKLFSSEAFDRLLEREL